MCRLLGLRIRALSIYFNDSLADVNFIASDLGFLAVSDIYGSSQELSGIRNSTFTIPKPALHTRTLLTITYRAYANYYTFSVLESTSFWNLLAE